MTSAFNQKPSYPQDIQPAELEDRNREPNEVPTLQEEVVSGLLCCLDMHTSREMPSFPPKAMEGAGEAAHKTPLSMAYQQSWLTGELLVDWTWANVTPIYEKAWKDNWENHRPVSRTSVPGKGMEQITLSAITQCVLHHWGIRPSQYGFKQVLLG